MKKTLYIKTYEKLKEEITSGIYSNQEKLPSEEALSEFLGVSKITIKRALGILKEEGYIKRVPRIGTTIIKSSKKMTISKNNEQKLIGLMVSGFDELFGLDLLDSLIEDSKNKYNLIVKKSNNDVNEEERIIRSLIDAGISGLIFMPSSYKYTPPIILELISKKFPIVIIDRFYDGIPVSSVSTDNYGSVKKIMKFFFNKSHQRIGFISPCCDISSLLERKRGFLDFYLSSDLKFSKDYILEIPPIPSFDDEENYNKIISFIKQYYLNFKPTAIIATEYRVALLIKDALSSLNIKIPQDVEVVCFDSPKSFEANIKYQFSHLKQNQSFIGISAIRELEKSMKDPSYFKKTFIDSEFISGQSTTF